MPELTTLLLAWQLARVEGRNQSDAIQRTASIIRRETKDRATYTFATQLVGADTPDARVVAISKLHIGLVASGIL